MSRDYYPLSIPQKSVWEIQQFYNGTSIANIGGTYVLYEELRFDIWEQAINLLIEKNESMRLRIQDDNGTPMQYLNPYLYRKLELVDFKEVKEDEINEIISGWMRTPFNIYNSDLFEFKMIKRCNNECGFFIKLHHLVSDAWTIALLGQQTINDYRALVDNTHTNYTIPSYVEYLENEMKYFTSKRYQKDISYWRDKYLDKPPLSPIKKLGITDFNPIANRATFNVNQDLAEKINMYCTENVISPAILFEAAVILYFNKFTSESDTTIGVLSLNRSGNREKQMTGMFINTLPLRIKFESNLSFKEMCKTLSGEHLAVFKHQKYPYRKIIDHVRERHGSIRGLFDVVVSYQNAKILVNGQNDNFKTTWYHNGYSEVPLKINIDDRDDTGKFILHFDYQTSVFDKGDICKINDQIINILDQAISTQDITMQNFGIVPLEGKSQIYREKIKDNQIQIKIASTFTSQPIGDYIKWWGNRFGYSLKIEFAGYNQVFQELLNSSSILSMNTNGINIVLIRFEDFIRSDNGTEEEKILKLEKTFKELKKIVHQFQNTAPFIYTILPVSTHLGLSNAVFNKISELNTGIMHVLLKHKNIHVIDLHSLQELYCIEEVFDSIKDREGHMPFTEEYYAAIGTEIARKICAIKKQHFKVIVLDCDDTLWKGICGEQGALCVEINDYYRELQEFMVQKVNEGMLLAICSKNNEKDVLEVFDRNPNMILDRKHIVKWKINWQEKSQCIREIAEELNLGLDSFIFIDDSPIECSKMVETCPEVLTLQLPKEELIPIFLKHIWAFDRLKVTKEDTLRSTMYAAEQKRKELEDAGITLDDFMNNLELKVSMRVICEGEIERAAQLTQRTNQFNLSTKRRMENEIKKLMENNKVRIFVVEASDKFGDYGVIGLVILNEEKDRLLIDTFLLSCRILGRKVEDVLLSGIRRHAKEQGINAIEATLIPNGKNQPLLDFIKRSKWAVVERNKDHIKYNIDINDLSHDIKHIDFYYNERYKVYFEENKALEGKDVFTPRYNAMTIKDTKECELCDTKILEGTKHKEYLLPLENFTGKKLLKLPTYEDVLTNLGQYEGPRNEIEEKLVDIWKQVLKVERVGIDDNFFELGGDSLKAIQVLSHLYKYKLEIKIQDIYSYSTIRELSQYASVSNEKGSLNLNSQWEMKPFDYSNYKHTKLQVRPLSEAIISGNIPRLDAAALSYIPDDFISIFGQDEFNKILEKFDDMPVMYNYLDTGLGKIGVMLLPILGKEIYNQKEKLINLSTGAIHTVEKLGARIVSLTGLIPSATGYGLSIMEDFKNCSNIQITTGHTTTSATVILSLVRLLSESGRILDKENICVLGLGSIGTIVIELLLTVLSHPSSITLCDISEKNGYLVDLKQKLKEKYAYKNEINIVLSKGIDLPDEIYKSSLIIGATNVPNILDVSKLKPGTLIIDDSAPHCFSTGDAIKRLKNDCDILFTEGGTLNSPTPIEKIVYLPKFINPIVMKNYQQHFLGSTEITGCILSSLLSTKFRELKPVSGNIDIEDCRKHYEILVQHAYTGALLHCDDFYIPKNLILNFKRNYGDKC
jgi:iturin family lipopeptide synthetase A